MLTRSLRSPIITLLPVAGFVATAVLPRPASAAPPILSVLSRPISPAPSAADGVQLRIYGDKSGALLQVRLLSPAQDGMLSGYHVATVPIDFEGWKTLTLPHSDFKFASDTNPDARQDGLCSRETLSASQGVQIAVLSSNAKIAINELAWATGESSVAPMESFDAASLKQWKAVGDFEQIKGVRFGGVTSGALSENGKPSLQIVVRNPALFEQSANKASADARIRRTPAIPFAIYTRAPFDPIYLESVPSPAELATPATVRAVACAEETEPATFAVYTTRDIKNATVKVAGTFAAPGRSPIPASAVEVHVVRTGNTYPAPQVLMKDDREALTGPLPTVRLTGDPVTDIAAGTSKQFWLTVRVPKNALPGTYQGKLVFSGAGIKPTPIPMTITVPDLTLKTAFLQYGIELRSRVGGASDTMGGDVVPQTMYAGQLSNIREHGFRLVQIFQNVANLENDMRLYKEAGLSNVGPVIVALNNAEEAAQIEAMKASLGLSREFNIYYYIGPDKMSGGSIREMGAGVNAVNRNALITAVVETTDTYKMLSESLNDQGGEELAPIYPICSDYAQKVISQGKRSTPNRDYWRWSIPDQSAIRNRLLAGMILYKTGPGFYGAFPGPYQRVPEGTSPYAAFEATEGTMMTVENRPAMTTFPVQGGVLDTLQWEAAREGVDDIRYIGALKAIIRELKDAKKAKAETDAAEAMLVALTNRPLLSMTPAQHQATRQQILNEVIKLRYILEPARRPKK